jgi:hypothetical protein
MCARSGKWSRPALFSVRVVPAAGTAAGPKQATPEPCGRLAASTPQLPLPPSNNSCRIHRRATVFGHWLCAKPIDRRCCGRPRAWRCAKCPVKKKSSRVCVLRASEPDLSLSSTQRNPRNASNSPVYALLRIFVFWSFCQRATEVIGPTTGSLLGVFDPRNCSALERRQGKNLHVAVASGRDDLLFAEEGQEMHHTLARRANRDAP